MSVIAAAAAGTAFVVLFLAGGQHLLRPARFQQDIRAQRVVAVRLIPIVSWGFSITECVLGAVGIVAWVTMSRAFAAASLSTALLYAVLTAYTSYLVRYRVGVPCGCGARETPIVFLTVIRAGILATLAALAGLIGLAETPTWGGSAAFALQVASVAVSSYLFWTLPTTSGDAFLPDGSTAGIAVRR